MIFAAAPTTSGPAGVQTSSNAWPCTTTPSLGASAGAARTGPAPLAASLSAPGAHRGAAGADEPGCVVLFRFPSVRNVALVWVWGWGFMPSLSADDAASASTQLSARAPSFPPAAEPPALADHRLLTAVKPEGEGVEKRKEKREKRTPPQTPPRHMHTNACECTHTPARRHIHIGGVMCANPTSIWPTIPR